MAGLVAEHAALEKKWGSAADAKEGLVGNRYKSGDAIKQLADAIAFLKEKSGIAEESKDAPAEGADEKKEEPAEDNKEAENEGGDEDNKEEGADEKKNEMEGEAEKVNPHSNETGDDDCSGADKVPMAVLRCMVAHPIVGDIIKQEVISCEMNHEKFKAAAYAGIAGLIGPTCAAKQDGDAEFFLSGHVSKQDTEALNDITQGDSPLKAIHFPFLTYGWKTEEEAKQALVWDSQNMKGDYDAVVFKVTGAKSFNFLGCRQVAHKINGEIAKAGETKDGVTTYEVTASPMEAQTIKEWDEAIKAAAAAAKAATDKPATEEKKEGEGEEDKGEENKEGEEKAEGE